jgi:hypothetical protein
MSVLYVAPMLPELPADPTPGDLYSHIIELRIIADRVSYEGAIAIMPVGSVVPLAALCAIAAPLPEIPIPSVNPDDVMPWLERHGSTGDQWSEIGALASCSIGAMVPTLAGMLAMQCPAELEVAISARMG